MDFKKINNLTGWIVFAIATMVYLLTIEPSVSLWDCGEYITTAYKLEVGHPPGAPTFMMLGAIFSSFVEVENVAMMINAMSALSSSFSILFLFWTITYFAKKLAFINGEELDKGKIIAIIGSGVIGALGFTFTDSFWFNAVEGEVYAMSSFLTAIVFWAILKWEEVANEPNADRWIVLIFFLIGLSIGVHLLNLLTIPAMGYVYYFKKYKFSWKGFFTTGIISVFILGFVQAGIIPGIVKIAAWFERFSVNSLGLPFNVGAFVFAVLLTVLIALGLYYTRVKSKVMLNTVILSFLVLLIGYSSFAMIVIRSSANTPLDENDPSTLTSLLAYLNREQYGSAPILYGKVFNAPAMYEKTATGGLTVAEDDGSPQYMKVYEVTNGSKTKNFKSKFDAIQFVKTNKGWSEDLTSKYIIENVDPKTGEYVNKQRLYPSNFKMLFPRMYYGMEAHKVQGYKDWSGYVGKPTRVYTKEGDDITSALGGEINKPTFSENIRYFVNYQIGWMYLRYFMWNFVGRQMDTQGHNDNLYEGQWKSGVNFVDAERLGDQRNLPSFISRNKANNSYYFLPLILGLIGLVYHFYKQPNSAWIVSLLFLMTGFAILIYLNQKPFEPRERDYAYAGSFYAFAIWMGLGVYALFDLATSLTKNLYVKLLSYGFGSAIFFYVVESISSSSHALSYASFYLVFVVALLLGVMLLLRNSSSVVIASVATVLGLAVPVVLAAENWDDHSRADRYAAREIARNYLESCDPNAILFTNGDNDTFPLWYMQEVEGVRTDIRVVNLSLLSTDWHIDQMKRKVYDDGLPVPFTLEEEKYRPSSRSALEIKKSKNGKYYPLAKVVDVASDDKYLQESPFGGTGAYIATDKVFIKVNKENAIKRGIVPKGMEAFVEDTVRWTIKGESGPYLVKSDLMVLDLLAHYNWDRPIYFASMGGMQANSGLKDYMVQDGLTYKLTPIKNTYSKGIDTDKMKTKLLSGDEVFEWGGLNSKDVYVDNYLVRMTYSIRNAYLKLADQLIRDGDLDDAQKVLDKSLEELPDYNVSLKARGMNTATQYAQLYAKTGNFDKADEFYVWTFDTYSSEMLYFSGLDVRFLGKSYKDIFTALRECQLSYNEIVDQEKSKEIASKYKNVLNQLSIDLERMTNESMESSQSSESYQYLQELKRYVVSFKQQNRF